MYKVSHTQRKSKEGFFIPVCILHPDANGTLFDFDNYNGQIFFGYDMGAKSLNMDYSD